MNEFSDNSARIPQKPTITIEKLIIKDGESIHLKKIKSPPVK